MLVLAVAAKADPTRFAQSWPQTDFSRVSFDLAQVISGGPPKDGIPAIDSPRFRPAAQETRLTGREAVLTYEQPGSAPRAYPIRYLIWHEIVNDLVDAQPIAVTYCPLCNSAMVFDARVDGQRHSFGVSGLLRHSDMIMDDRETESWWQQAVGEGIAGRHMGARLRQLPAWMESWDEFRARNPGGLGLEEPDYRRAYGQNPYVGYDSATRPFLYHGEDPPHGIHPLARVVRVGNRAWTYEPLRGLGEIREAGVVLTWQAGQASALDTRGIGADLPPGSSLNLM
ncbi:MAG: DUF3179 domain-containing protein [Roseinatronobacter sp.]